MRVQDAPPIADTSIFRITDSPSGPLPYNVILTTLYNADSAARDRDSQVRDHARTILLLKKATIISTKREVLSFHCSKPHLAVTSTISLQAVQAFY